MREKKEGSPPHLFGLSVTRTERNTALANDAETLQHEAVIKVVLFAFLLGLASSGCYTSHGTDDGGSSIRDASPVPRDGAPIVRDGATRDGGRVDATRPPPPPPPPPPDLIAEGCMLICDVTVRCFDEPDDRCFEECFDAASMLPDDVCAELWLELADCVSEAPCEVIYEDGLETFCGPVVERLGAECGLMFGGGGSGGMSGGGSTPGG